MESLSFIAEWLHAEAAIVHTFLITFYLSDNALEAIDQRTKKMFLRRTKMMELTKRDFFVGSKINVFGRQFDIIDYGDDFTRNLLSKFRQKGFVLLKHFLWSKFLAELLITISDSHMCINNGFMVEFTPKMVKEFLGNQDENDSQTSVLMNELLAGPVIALELVGNNIVEVWSALQNAKTVDSSAANIVPAPLDDFFTRVGEPTGFYCSKSDSDVQKDMKFIFERQRQLLKDCLCSNTTLGIIKPHCIKNNQVGHIVKDILQNGFQINTMRMVQMSRANCEEFYEVYLGLLPEYIGMVGQLASGPCMCLEIKCNDTQKDSQTEFRNFCGPLDPEIAKELRPRTLRAKYGVSKAMNAVHCTDLPEDTDLELQYIFNNLA